MPSSRDPGFCANLASYWEATARKAGNVHPGASFPGLNYMDFVLSAAAIAPVFARAPQRPVGETVLEAVRATRGVVGTNTNLGIILLLAPLAAVPADRDADEGIVETLFHLDLEDSRNVFAAIRAAQPGGMGEVSEENLDGDPTLPLQAIMMLAAKQDLIARQYVNGFRDVFRTGVPALSRYLRTGWAIENAIVATHLEFMARFPDSLIQRKRGVEVAEDAGRRARAVLDAGWPDTAPGRAAFTELDAWLRADGNARNPGTSADLVTACLFVLLRDNDIQLPLCVPWSRG